MSGIYNNLAKITDIKNDIKQSITNKGIDMTDVPFADYPEKIDEIVVNGDYQIGYDAGRTYQKSLLIPFTITQNGTYERQNGYSKVIVNIEDNDGDYQQGYTDGYSKGSLDGYENGFGIGEEYGYNNGVAVGKEQQKSLLQPISITENGTYQTENGYSEVNVSVQKGVDVSILELDEFYFLKSIVLEYQAHWDANYSRIEDYYRRNQSTSTYMLFENVGGWDSYGWVKSIEDNVTDLLNLDGVTDLGALAADEYDGEITYSDSVGQYFYGIECTNIITTSNAFKGCNFMLRSLSGLGTSFELPQIVVLPSYNAYEDDRRDSYIMEMVESLYDFMITNKNGVRTSTLQFPFEPNEDIVSRVIEKGWLVTVVADI